VAGVGAQVDPEGRGGAALDLEDRALELLEGHRGRGEDAQTAGVRRARDEPRSGDPAHPGLDDRVPDADELGERGRQLLVDHAAGTSLNRRPLGSSTSRIRMSSSAVGVRVSGTAAGSVTPRSKPVASWTSATLTPGCTDSSRTVSSAPLTSKTARLVTIRWMSLYLLAATPASLARLGPTPETTSTASTKTRGEGLGTQYRSE